MLIQIDPHTLERAQERGASEAEIKDVIDTGVLIPAKYGRIGRINRRLSEDIVLDMGEDDRIVGIEIIDASKHLNLATLLPVEYMALSEAV